MERDLFGGDFMEVHEIIRAVGVERDLFGSNLMDVHEILREQVSCAICNIVVRSFISCRRLPTECSCVPMCLPLLPSALVIRWVCSFLDPSATATAFFPKVKNKAKIIILNRTG